MSGLLEPYEGPEIWELELLKLRCPKCGHILDLSNDPFPDIEAVYDCPKCGFEGEIA